MKHPGLKVHVQQQLGYNLSAIADSMANRRALNLSQELQ